MQNILEKAYAKINLYLDVESKRDDGYHNIISIMQSISLCDNIKIKFVDGEEILILCNIEGIPCDRSNLAYRAADAFFNALGRKCGIEIDIEKNIPFAAGLGGGSSDAAAVLRGLNCMFDNKFTIDDLCKIGATIGADVPFCIMGGCAEVTGIGDMLIAQPPMPKCYIVLSCAGEGISTPTAYRKLDEKFNNFENYALNDNHKLIKHALNNSNIQSMCDAMANVFEDVILRDHFEASDIKAKMMNCGALTAMMSGSGPSVFGIFDSEQTASLAFNNLKESGYQTYMCYPKC